LSRTGRVQVYWGPERGLRLETIPVPEPQDAEILVRVTACTLCGSDVHTHSGRREVAVPTVLGHEIIGRIDDFGPDAPRRDWLGRELRIGDRITWGIIASCGACFYCRRSLPQKCERQVKYGHETGIGWTGGMGEFCLLAPGTSIFLLPDSLPDAVACPLSCATATVACALRALGGAQGKTVLVQGAGMLGLTACGLARAQGATCILCVDPDPIRRERALKFGADLAVAPTDIPEAVRRATDGYGIDIALELSGDSTAFETGLQCLRMGGKLGLVGAVFPSAAVGVHPEALVRRCLTVAGVHNYAPEDLATALAFLSDPVWRSRFENLAVVWFPLDEAEAAFRATHDPNNLRGGLSFPR
jgi:putative phosphonate catabolism associated alcohol dehydrogenase